MIIWSGTPNCDIQQLRKLSATSSAIKDLSEQTLGHLLNRLFAVEQFRSYVAYGRGPIRSRCRLRNLAVGGMKFPIAGSCGMTEDLSTLKIIAGAYSAAATFFSLEARRIALKQDVQWHKCLDA